MLKTLFTSLLLFAVSVIKAQIYLPVIKADSTQDVAQYINANYKGEESKVKAIYQWVISNITFDADSSRIINAGPDPDAKITLAFKRRKGVCENFSAIFNDICHRSGIQSYIINGYTQQNIKVDKAAHAWCGVLINHKWYLFDPTWDAGNVMNPKYFMAAPVDFIQSHIPFDPLWQMLEYPVTHEQFYKNNFSRNSKSTYFNFADSIKAYAQMDSLQKLKTTLARIEKMGLYNSRINENYKLLRSYREMIYQDEVVNNYDLAMAELNEAADFLNQFIQWRNGNSEKSHDDTYWQQLLNAVDVKINSSLLKLDAIDKSKASLVLGTEAVRERIQGLLKKNQDQQVYLKEYLDKKKKAG